MKLSMYFRLDLMNYNPYYNYSKTLLQGEGYKAQPKNI